MGLRVQFTPISREVLLRIPAQQEADAQALFGAFVVEQIGLAEMQNEQELGHVVDYTASVAGRATTDFSHLPPLSEVVVEFDVQSAKSDALAWIFDQLLKAAPVGSGRDPHPGLYRSTIVLLRDGVEVGSTEEAAVAGPDDEIVFVDLQPYARKVDRRLGVFEGVAAMAASRFGAVANIRFTFRTLDGAGTVGATQGTPRKAARASKLRRQLAVDMRQPAITVAFK